jgi:hypothetical protein
MGIPWSADPAASEAPAAGTVLGLSLHRLAVSRLRRGTTAGAPGVPASPLFSRPRSTKRYHAAQHEEDAGHEAVCWLAVGTVSRPRPGLSR